MASEAQIAANRANAKRSTGPKTEGGRQKSSRNALKHGLSLPLVPDTSTMGMIETIETALLSEARGADVEAARAFAFAQIDLLRIRKSRQSLIDGADFGAIDSKQLNKILALDRYERYALTRRRLARAKLDAKHGQDEKIGKT